MECFLRFLFNFLFFENFCHFLPKKLEFWQKILGFFWLKFSEIKHKSEKAFPRYLYLDGFGTFLVIFCQEVFFFYPCSKILAPKIDLWRFLKNSAFSPKFESLNKFLVKFLF